MKFKYNQEVYIKEDFYRGYKARILEWKSVKTKEQGSDIETEEILYLLKIDGINLKSPYWLEERKLIPYKKYVFF